MVRGVRAPGRLCDRLIHPEGPEIRVTEALFFVPATDEKPFAFVQELFDLRASIVAEDEDDVRGVILKLALNSIYGKLAQSVGRKGNPPAFASPWMAAAITAGTRRKLIEAALTAPNSIVCFATDGIVSTTPLAVFVPPTKTLGHWEHKEAKHGGVFVQSGVYAVIKDQTKGDGAYQGRVARVLSAKHRRQRESLLDAGHAQGPVRRHSQVLERRKIGLCFRAPAIHDGWGVACAEPATSCQRTESQAAMEAVADRLMD